MIQPYSNTLLTNSGAVSDANDLLHLRPLRVLAGQEVRAGEFALRRGRKEQ